MKAIHRNLMYSLVLAVLSLLVLQGCVHRPPVSEITRRQLPDVVMATVEAHRSEGFISYRSSDGRHGFSLSRISDTSFVLGQRTTEGTGKLSLYNKALAVQWSNEFPLYGNEHGIVWYRNSKVAIVTEYYEDDTLIVVGRHFEAGSGKLLSSNRIAVVPMEDRYSVFYYISPDSSKLLVRILSNRHKISRYLDQTSYSFITLSHDLTIGTTASRDVIHHYELLPSIALNNLGEVIYTTYRIDDETGRYETVRLKGNIADTLAFIRPGADDHESIVPSEVIISPINDHTVLVAWQQTDDNETKDIATGIFDFERRKASMESIGAFDPQELELLIDNDQLKEFYLNRMLPLASGNTLLVLYQMNLEVSSHGGGPHMVSYSRTSYLTGPLLVIMLNTEGKMTWKTFLKRSGKLRECVDCEVRPACIISSSDIHFFYRNWEDSTGITYAKVSLKDGSVFTRPLPLVYSVDSIFLPGCTMLNSDGTAVVVGLEEYTGKLIKFPLQ